MSLILGMQPQKISHRDLLVKHNPWPLFALVALSVCHSRLCCSALQWASKQANNQPVVYYIMYMLVL